MTKRFGYPTKHEMSEAIRTGAFIPKGRDLSGIDLSGCSLTSDDEGDERRETDFSGCNLSGSNLSGCELFGVVFRGAVLDGCSFAKANMEHSNFCGAKGRDVDFGGIDDIGSRFNDAELPGAKWGGAVLDETKFYGADLSGGSFVGIAPKRVGFRFTRFNGADLTGGAADAILKGANIVGSTVDGARFDDGAEARWTEGRTECDVAHAKGDGGVVDDPRLRALAKANAATLGSFPTRRGVEHIDDIVLAKTDEWSREVVEQVLKERDAVDANCRLASEWWAGKLRAARDRNAADNPTSGSGKVPDAVIDDFQRNLFAVMMRRRSPEARSDYNADHILSAAFPRGWLGGGREHDEVFALDCLVPHKSGTYLDSIDAGSTLRASGDSPDGGVLREPEETYEQARARIDAARSAARNFNLERDAHRIGADFGTRFFNHAGVPPTAVGEFQKAVVARVTGEGVDGLMGFMQETAERIAGKPLDVHHRRSGAFRIGADGSVSQADWPGSSEFREVTGGLVGEKDRFERRYVAGCEREVVKRDGSWVRYDLADRVHCDGAPAVCNAQGRKSWFVHGAKGKTKSKVEHETAPRR